MKFWKKLILFNITIISIVLSISRYYVVKSNFSHSLENSITQNKNQFFLEKYMLESNIIKNIQQGEEINNYIIIEELKNLNKYTGNNSEIVLLYNGEYEQIYSNSEVGNLNLKNILEKEDNICVFQQINSKHYMVFFSHFDINSEKVTLATAYEIELLYIEVNRQLREIFFADAIILLISSIVISIFSWFLTKPINTLNKSTKKIAKGNFSEKVNINSKDEIGELAESFNKMSDEIEAKIKELNLQVKQKNDFINGFTHEIKTPMTAIMGYSDLLRLKKCDKEVSNKALNYIYSETKRLEKLSHKLMKLMSITEDKLNFTGINIKTYMEKIAKNLILKNANLKLEIEEANVLSDTELLEIVIRNLVQNADNASPKKSIVLVKGERNLEKYKISVIDSGKGIPKDEIKRVTEDFYMVDKARSKENGGTGIGLSLVSKILDFHKSKLNIESTENVGTTVYFELDILD